MLAASFFQILLAVTVFTTAVTLFAGSFAALLCLMTERPRALIWAVPAWVVFEVLVLSTFLWLGSGPLNG